MATWRDVLGERSGQRALATTAIAFVLTLYGFSFFLGMVERRSGVVLADPLLAAFPAHDLTWPIFVIIYGSLVVAIVVLMRDPMRLLLALRAYVALVLIRMLCMWAVPLEPPLDMIPLVDPLVQAVTGAREALSRDLFFSGHTSILTLLACVMPQRRLQILFIVLASMMGCFVLLQHVHYTIDVLVAPMAAYAAYKLIRARSGLQVRQ
ncbi:hypothetical protein BH10BAC6_BH10BAC6_03370 [soil metagenome]